jgi:hypothetical protein
VVFAAAGAIPGTASAKIQVTSFTAGPIGPNATQAGAHADVQAVFMTAVDPAATLFGLPIQAETTKDVAVELPPGFVGSTTAAPKCTLTEFAAHDCPVTSQVGSATVISNAAFLTEGTSGSADFSVYLLQPSEGNTAEFGFTLGGIGNVLAVASVRSGSDYGLHIALKDLPSELLPFMFGARLTLWGVPADPSHDAERSVRGLGFVAAGETGVSSSAPLVPFLTNPTRCAGSPEVTSLSVDSWQSPGQFDEETSATPPLTGCDRLPFAPSLDVQPDRTQASAPAGYEVHLQLPQNENPGGLATADLETAVVTLPQGVTVSPSAAEGLGACSPGQISLGSTSRPSCPESSKIGSVTIDTPLLEHPLEGSVYLARQGDNPFGTLLAVYLVAEGSGVTIKLPGKVDADPVTGQLTVTFDNNPQLPFSDLRLAFKSGQHAALVNPAACGTYTTRSQLTSWSGKTAQSESSFQITEGQNGSPCPTGAFNPSFTAGTTSNQAGSFSPFTLAFSRSDGDQTLGGITLRLPPGLLGALKSVPQCPEPQASNGGCGPASEIGRTSVAAGAGQTPFWLGGKVFLTDPHKGAPFGLSIVVPAIAGPFNLGTVVVRAAVNVDPHTAQVIVTSDALPTILEGIPLDLQTVNMTIDRSGFMFNPTSCATMSVDGTISSTQGVSSTVSSHFQAANCANLPFKPKLTALTQAKYSKAGGESLHVKVTSGSGEANIGKVRVLLPKLLPSRLTTLQKACPEATFNANPAACPAASVVGTGTAVTPVLAHPLTGPAYLVSHGGAAFPDLVVVLQGEGITLYLDGNTDIKHGITSSTFNSVPDAPISTFDLVLPQGPHSALAANGNLCKTALSMPTTITGQNGARVTQSTRIAVAGCARHKAKAHRANGRKRGHR